MFNRQTERSGLVSPDGVRVPLNPALFLNPNSARRVMKWCRPKTKEQLYYYIRIFFKFNIPYIPYCSNHCTPFDMLWSLWTDLYDSMVCIGCRDGYKTLTLGISEVLDLVFKDVGIVHIGAIDEQAKKCYAYVRNYLDSEFSAAVNNSIISRTVMNEGGNLQIIPCTMKRVNSPHEPKVRFDEVELADEAAYADAKGIPSSDGKGNSPSICYTTTRKYAFGLAQREIDMAIKNNQPVFMWCYLDITERCTEERCGKGNYTIWVNRDTLEWAREKPAQVDAGIMQDNASRKIWILAQVSEGCLSCPIAGTCFGRLRGAHGCKPIRDIIVKFRTSTIDFWKAQMECRKPSSKGLVVWAFDEELHTSDFEVTKKDIYTGQWLIIGGKDFNYTPQAALLAFLTPTQLLIYDEIYMDQATVKKCAEHMDKKWFKPLGRPQSVECDFTRPDSIDDMKANGVEEACATECHDVESAVDFLNTLFCPTTYCSDGTLKSFIHIHKTNCHNLIWELSQGYRRSVDNVGKVGKIVRENNHYVDCLRMIAFKYCRCFIPATEIYVNNPEVERFYGDEISGRPNEFGKSHAFTKG